MKDDMSSDGDDLTKVDKSLQRNQMSTDKPAPWEDESIPETERWLIMLDAVDNGQLEFDRMIEIAKTFSEEVRSQIRESARESLRDLN